MISEKVPVKILAYKAKGSGSLTAHLISFLLDSPYYHFEVMLDDTRIVSRLGQRTHLEILDDKTQSLVMHKKIKIIYMPPIDESKFHETLYFIKEYFENMKYDWISLVNNYLLNKKSILNYQYNKYYL